jgi:hypothetical protein
MPPRDPANPGPSARRPGSGPGRHSAGPGYPPPGAPRPGPPGAQGAQGPQGPAEPGQFDGGYAYVIRGSEHPVRPSGHARPASRADEPPADVYVYRDTPDQPAGQAPAGRDASYWYDLSGDESAPVVEETRGPFEPLVSSDDPPPVEQAPPEDPEEGTEDSTEARARKLEQIKDFYLTAEAIGEDNVDKHFDQLLAQQRDLISEYFKKPGPDENLQAQDQKAPDQKAPDEPSQPKPRHARVSAEQPRVW